MDKNLKQLLAEKEEQISILEEHKIFADNIINGYVDKCRKHNQDKINFAVELLEQVRQEIAVKDKIGLRLFIDGKIKQLKEMK